MTCVPPGISYGFRITRPGVHGHLAHIVASLIKRFNHDNSHSSQTKHQKGDPKVSREGPASRPEITCRRAIAREGRCLISSTSLLTCIMGLTYVNLGLAC